MARVMVLDVEKGEVRIAHCNSLDDYYKNLNCDCFDVVSRVINGSRYDIYCDDEGTFKESPIISAVDTSDNPMLVGNLIFANHNEAGETTSLTLADINVIFSGLCRIITNDRPQGYIALRCSY